MIQTTATDFKANLGKYLTIVGREDVHITKNGSDIAVLTAPKTNSGWVEDLIGIIPDPGPDFDAKRFKEERLAEKYESLN